MEKNSNDFYLTQKELNEFKIEVLTQLAVINSKLDGYNKVQEIAVQSNNRSLSNEQRLDKIEDNNKWAFRTSVGALITSGIALVFLFIKLGMGM